MSGVLTRRKKLLLVLLLAVSLCLLYRRVNPAQTLFAPGAVPSGVAEVSLELEEWSAVGEPAPPVARVSVDPAEFFRIMGGAEYRRALFPPEKRFGPEDFPMVRFTVVSDAGETRGLLCAGRPYLYLNDKCYHLPGGGPYEPLRELVSA